MRNRTYVLAALAATLVAGCAGSRATEYSLPPDVTGENRALLVERFRKGKVLFRAHCAGCHGIFTQGRDSIPNFTTEQIDNYDANFVRADPKNHAVGRRLSQQQVDHILTFLRLRSREAR